LRQEWRGGADDRGRKPTGDRQQATGNGETEREKRATGNGQRATGNAETQKQATGDRQQATGNAETQPAPPPPPPLDIPTEHPAPKGRRIHIEMRGIKSVGKGVRIHYGDMIHKGRADGSCRSATRATAPRMA
jgi:hypothetical protein